MVKISIITLYWIVDIWAYGLKACHLFVPNCRVLWNNCFVCSFERKIEFSQKDTLSVMRIMPPVFEALCEDMGPENITAVMNGTHNYSKTVHVKRPCSATFELIFHCSLETPSKQAALIVVIEEDFLTLSQNSNHIIIVINLWPNSGGRLFCKNIEMFFLK